MSEAKIQKYEAAYEAIKAKLADQDFPAKQKILSEEIGKQFDRFNFVGYYDVRIKPNGGGKLYLTIGEYVSVDVIPCGEIEMGRGQCGLTAEKGRFYIVKDTKHVSNYIACDTETKSEICLPCFSEDGKVVAVLDLDGLDANLFDKTDEDWLNKCNRLIYPGTGFELYNNFTGNVHTNAVFASAAMCGFFDLREIQMTVEERKKPENMEKLRNSASPCLVTPEGVLNDSSAIMRYIARKTRSDIIGRTNLEQAQVDQWTGYTQGTVWPAALRHFSTVFGWNPSPDCAQHHSESAKAIKEIAMFLNKALEGKTFLVGERVTIADIHLWGYLEFTFQVTFDEGFRKAIPNLSAWFERVNQVQEMKDRYGLVQLPKKAMKPYAPKGGFQHHPFASHILYNNAKFNVFTHTCMIAANVVEFKGLQEVVTELEQRNNSEFKKLMGTTKCPQLKTPDGILVESVAIAKYFARMNRSKGLLGETKLDEAQIDKWLFWGQTTVVPTFGKVLAPMFGWIKVPVKDQQEGVK